MKSNKMTINNNNKQALEIAIYKCKLELNQLAYARIVNRRRHKDAVEQANNAPTSGSLRRAKVRVAELRSRLEEIGQEKNNLNLSLRKFYFRLNKIIRPVTRKQFYAWEEENLGMGEMGEFWEACEQHGANQEMSLYQAFRCLPVEDQLYLLNPE